MRVKVDIWAVHPSEPSGFRGRKELLNRALALVTTSSLICQLTSEDIKQDFTIQTILVLYF